MSISCSCGNGFDDLGICQECGTSFNINVRENISNDLNIINGKICIHEDIEVNIRATASDIFKLVNSFGIKRGRPRSGLILGCIYLAGLHNNYIITVVELSKLSGIESKYISTQLKNLVSVVKGCGISYDIRVTDDKYINRYILDLQHYCQKNGIPMSGTKLCRIRDELGKYLRYMNDNDILTQNTAGTRVCCCLYILLRKKRVSIMEADMLKFCKISKNTFRNYIGLLMSHESKLFEKNSKKHLSH